MMRRRRMMMIQKVALKSLKFGYVQVETLKFPRPCTLACNCKIIWDSEFDKVGGFPRKFQSYPVGEAFSKITLNFNLNKDFPVNWKCHEFWSGQISKSPSCAAHMSTRSSKASKPSKQSQAVRASKETQIKAKRARRICASKAHIIKAKSSYLSNLSD